MEMELLKNKSKTNKQTRQKATKSQQFYANEWNLLLYWTPLANFRCKDPDIGMHDAFGGADAVLALVPVAFAGNGGASCRCANFLNALNIFKWNFFWWSFASNFTATITDSQRFYRLFLKLSIHRSAIAQSQAISELKTVEYIFSLSFLMMW